MARATRRSVGDGLDLPAFLRVTPEEAAKRKKDWDEAGGKTQATTTEEVVEQTWLTPRVRLAQTAYEEAGFSVKRGVIPVRWKDDDVLIARIDADLLEEGEGTTREKKEKRVSPYAGMVRLTDVIKTMSPPVKRSIAQRAIEFNNIEHLNWRLRGGDWLDEVRGKIRAFANAAPTRVAAAPRVSLTGIIVVLVKKNPHKEGTVQHQRMKKLMASGGKTPEEYAKDGGDMTKLKHALSQSQVELKKKK